VSKRYYWKKIRPILLSITICSLFFLIIMAITSNRTGNLTIFVDRSSVTKCLSLSESKTFSNPQGKLYGPSINNAWDYTEDRLPKYADLIDGNNSGENYIAYTFYLFNSGIESLDYSMKFEIENVSNNLDEAIRVRLYTNDQLVTYAKKSALTGEEENATTSFESDKYIMTNTVTDFKPNSYTKYTIMIWVESDDRECTNDKIGGSMTLSLAFSVLGIV
jgi:hypothetical protein